jgi:hypothetical protein
MSMPGETDLTVLLKSMEPELDAVGSLNKKRNRQ